MTNAARPLILCLIACLAGALAAACGSGDRAARESAEAAGLRPVRLQLNWFPENQHGGFYHALVAGYFEEEGLAVRILPGGVDVPVAAQVATGRVEFGVADADRIVQNRAQGALVRAVLASFQESPRCIVVHAASGFESIADIRDVTLAMSNAPPFSAFVRKHAPLPGVRQVPYPGSVAPFLADPAFAMQGYVFSEPVVIRQRGGDPRVLMVSELGWNPYATCLVASDRLIEEDPDLVAAMVRASRRGWIGYLRDPEPANARIMAENPQMTPEILEAGHEDLRRLVLAGLDGEDQIGIMDPARWAVLADQLAEVEYIRPGAVDPASAFTNAFLEP